MASPYSCRSCSNRNGQAGSYSTTRITPATYGIGLSQRPQLDLRSGCGAFGREAAAQPRVRQGRGLVGLVEGADVGAGRDDLVDAVEDVVGEGDVQAGEQAVEGVHGADADQCARDAGVGDGERHRGVVHGQSCLGGGGYEPFDRVEPLLVTEGLDQAGTPQVVALVLAYAASEQSLAERTPDQGAHAEALDGGPDLAFDAAVEDGVGRLLGVGSREASPLGDPLGLA